MNFKDVLDLKTNETETENGARAFKTTNSKVLDFFAAIGGMRDRNEEDIIKLYLAARREDKELADKIILWVGSVRRGQGERRIRRILMRELAKIDPNKVIRNFTTFVENGRWDDLYSLEGTPVENEMWKFLDKELEREVLGVQNGEAVSCLGAKWFKSINTSSKESRRLAKKFCQVNGWNEKSYRKILAMLRKYSDVVESKMSARKWNCIDYSTVPSCAMMRYSEAFQKHAPERWEDYMEKLKEGKTKVNASTLYPYNIFEKIGESDIELLQRQWDSLPNYFEKPSNIIVMADVSGSMYGRPMEVSTSLALYCAQKNSGVYHNYCMTFTDEPRFFKFEENENIEEARGRLREHIGYNTNLDGALEAVYQMAIEAGGDVPEALLVISDCEIDYFMSSGVCDSIIDKYIKKFGKADLEMPKVIFWNVEARNNHYLDKMNNPYVGFISGCAATTFKEIENLIYLSPYESMVKILDQFEFI